MSTKGKNENGYSQDYSKKTLIQELKYLFYAEKYMIRLMQRLEKAASTKYLKASFRGHYIATASHIKRLEEAFSLVGQKPVSKKCSVFDELERLAIHAIKNTAKHTQDRDLALIDIAQRLEISEIKKYNELVSLANDLGNFKLVFLFEETLLEEKEAAETFEAVKEDTLTDDLFKSDNSEEEDAGEEEVEEFEVIGRN